MCFTEGITVAPKVRLEIAQQVKLQSRKKNLDLLVPAQESCFLSCYSLCVLSLDVLPVEVERMEFSVYQLLPVFVHILVIEL